MSCSHPYRLFPTGYLTENGKPEYYFDSHLSPFITPLLLEKKWPDRKWPRPLTDFIEVGCGKCPSCRKDYIHNWNMRLTAEALLYEPGQIWFFTFTYDNEHLPKDPKDSKKDFSDFMRSLRDFMGHRVRIRFFGVGELGELNSRIHVHAVIFGFDFNKFLAKIPFTKNGFTFPMIDKIWNKGFVLGEPCNGVGGVSAYVLKYMLKDADKLVWKQASLKPGIGFGYLEKLALEMDKDNPSACIVPTGKGGCVIGCVPKALRQRLDMSSKFLAYGAYLKLFNKMIDAGYSREEAVKYAFIEAYRESCERLVLEKQAFNARF